MAKLLSKADKEFLLNIKREDLGIKFITQLFSKRTRKEPGKFVIEEPRFSTKSLMHLGPNEYINKEAVDTNVGIFLWNKIFIEGKIEHAIPNHYFNEVINKENFGKIKEYISIGTMEKTIPVEPNLINFLKDYEFYSMKLSTIFCPSYSRALLETNDKVVKEKERLLADNDLNNLANMTKAEDALVAFAKKELGKDPGMTLYDSGARGSFGNDYKNMNLMLGPVKNESNNTYDFVKSNYIHGLQKEDLVAAGNVVVNSAYPKAVGTQDGGYLTKQFYSAYQSIIVDEDGTDCHSKGTLNLYLHDSCIEDFIYQTIQIKPGKYETLTYENMDKYRNKKVRLRSPMYCTTDKICSVCAGRRPYLLGIYNMGLTSGRVPNTLLNQSMKQFHQSKIVMDEVDVNDLLF